VLLVLKEIKVQKEIQVDLPVLKVKRVKRVFKEIPVLKETKALKD
jgi:hypothetical protein